MTDFDVWVAECEKCGVATFHESRRDAHLSGTLGGVITEERDDKCSHRFVVKKAVVDEYSIVDVKENSGDGGGSE